MVILREFKVQLALRQKIVRRKLIMAVRLQNRVSHPYKLRYHTGAQYSCVDRSFNQLVM